MRLSRISGFALLLALLGVASGARATVPSTLVEQGRLLDMSGAPQAGSVAMVFAIYDSPSNGEMLWSESQTVPLADGYFVAVLGSAVVIPPTVFDGSVRYLGVTVGSDPEMTPREEIHSVPYALVAGNVTGDITPSSVSVNGSTVINSSGQWVGPTSGLAGPAGPQGPQGPEGPTGPPGADGSPGVSVVASTEPAGTNCANGGVRVTSSSGIQFVCTGATGAVGPMGLQGPQGPQGDQGPQGAPGTSVTGMSEAPGPNCTYGGVALSSASGTQYVCNGVPGAPGAQGPMGAAGVPGVTYLGAWDGMASYSVGDVVTFNGSTYVASAPSSGVQPPAPGWDVMAAKGDTGPQGPQGATGPQGPQGVQGPQGPAGQYPGTIYVKGGDNGTASCSTYCAGSQCGTTGVCLGSKMPDGSFHDCSYIPGNIGGQLSCLCHTF